MIPIKKSDTLIDIIEKIGSVQRDSIILNFPIGHPILHSYLSLKIIKSKSGEKSITIVTNDLVSKRIGKNLWIHYSIVQDSEYIEEKNLHQEDLMKHNFSFNEYLIFEIKKYYRELSGIIKRNKNINTIKDYSHKYKSYSNIGLFVWLFFISLFLFVFIFYFAINKTTVTVTPEIYIKTKARNFIFKENNDFDSLNNDKIIDIYPLEENISIIETYSTTGIDASSVKKSQGKIKVSNLLLEKLTLLPQTRFITKDWLLFESLDSILLPAGKKDDFGKIIPWIAEVLVISKNYDISWSFIGSKWNIDPWEYMTLPWLEDNGTTVFAKSISSFTWGWDSYTLIVSEEDMKNSNLIFEQKLKSEVIKQLRKKIQKQNELNKTSLEILSIDDIVSYLDMDIQVKNSIKLWDKSNNIILEWHIIWKTYIYDKNKLLNRLKSVIQDNMLQWAESILLIDEKSLRTSTVLYRKNKPFEIKTTVEIDTLVSHDFLNKDNTYTEKLRNVIRGLSKQEAIRLLLNDSKVSNVDIQIRPFFISKISNIPENIIFKITKK